VEMMMMMIDDDNVVADIDNDDDTIDDMLSDIESLDDDDVIRMDLFKEGGAIGSSSVDSFSTFSSIHNASASAIYCYDNNDIKDICLCSSYYDDDNMKKDNESIDKNKKLFLGIFDSKEVFEALLTNQASKLKKGTTKEINLNTDLTADLMFHCPICEDDVRDSDKVLLSCGHNFCISCFRNYIKSVYQISPSGITCPFNGCKIVLSSSSALKFGGSDIVGEMRSLQFQAHGQNKKKCSECKETLAVPLKMIESHNYDVLICNKATCVNNGKLICFYCESTMTEAGYKYGFHSCKKNEGQMVKKSTGRFERSITRHCPNCFMVIVKNGGCPNMVCGTCKVRFCWNCLGPQDHAGYGGKCPGNKPTKFKKAMGNKYVQASAYVAFYTVIAPFVVAGAVASIPVITTAAIGKAAVETYEQQKLKRTYKILHHVLNGNVWWLPINVVYGHLGENSDPLMKMYQAQQNHTYTKVGPSNVEITLSLHRGGLRFPGALSTKKFTSIKLPPILQKEQRFDLNQVLDALAIIYQEIAYAILKRSPRFYHNDYRFSKKGIDSLTRITARRTNSFIADRLAKFLETLASSPRQWDDALNIDFRIYIRREIKVSLKNIKQL